MQFASRMMITAAATRFRGAVGMGYREMFARGCVSTRTTEGGPPLQTCKCERPGLMSLVGLLALVLVSDQYKC